MKNCGPLAFGSFIGPWSTQFGSDASTIMTMTCGFLIIDRFRLYLNAVTSALVAVLMKSMNGEMRRGLVPVPVGSLFELEVVRALSWYHDAVAYTSCPSTRGSFDFTNVYALVAG